MQFNSLVKQSANFVRFEWSTVWALSLGKGLIGLLFHSVLPCFMFASPVILCFTADVTNKLKVFLEFLYISPEFCFLWVTVSLGGLMVIHQRVLCVALVKAMYGRMRLPPWFLLGFIRFVWVFLLFFVVVQRKAVNCCGVLMKCIVIKLLAIPFKPSLVCWCHLDPKISNFLEYFELRNQTYKLQHDFIHQWETHQGNLYLISCSPWSLLPGSLQFHPCHHLLALFSLLLLGLAASSAPTESSLPPHS